MYFRTPQFFDAVSPLIKALQDDLADEVVGKPLTEGDLIRLQDDWLEKNETRIQAAVIQAMAAAESEEDKHQILCDAASATASAAGVFQLTKKLFSHAKREYFGDEVYEKANAK